MIFEKNRAITLLYALRAFLLMFFITEMFAGACWLVMNKRNVFGVMSFEVAVLTLLVGLPLVAASSVMALFVVKSGYRRGNPLRFSGAQLHTYCVPNIDIVQVKEILWNQGYRDFKDVIDDSGFRTIECSRECPADPTRYLKRSEAPQSNKLTLKIMESKGKTIVHAVAWHRAWLVAVDLTNTNYESLEELSKVMGWETFRLKNPKVKFHIFQKPIHILD